MLFLRRPRGKTPMDRAINEVENALERVGRPVTVGTTLTQLERRSARTRLRRRRT
jgi:hypothetical protein